MEPPPNLRDWLAVLRRHSVLAGGVAAVVTLIGAYVAYTSPPEYRARAVVRLVDERRALTGGLIDASATGDIALAAVNPVLSQVEVLRSRATLSAVVDEMPSLRIRTRRFPEELVANVRLAPTVGGDSLQLTFGREKVAVQGPTPLLEVAYGAPIEVRGIGFTIAEAPTRESGTLYIVRPDVVVNRLASRLQVKPRENTDVIDIAFTATDPERAQEVANRIAQVFRAGNTRSARQEARRRREFIETQLQFNDSLLTAARAGLSAFRARSPSPAAGPAITGGLEVRREDLEIERRQYAGLLDQLRDTSRIARRVALRNVIASSPGIAENAVVSRFYTQLVTYEMLRDSLTSGDLARTFANPDVQRLTPLIASAEANLIGAVQSVVASLNARIAVVDDLRARGLATARRLSNVQTIDEAMTLQVENARRIADQLRVEYQKARIAEAVEVGRVEIVDLAPLPEVPIGVGRMRMLVFGLLLGVMLGGGSAALADHLNRSVHRPQDVEHLGLPVLGVVPHARQNGGSSSTESVAPIIEAMRAIRFNVLHAYGAAGPVMFTVTSPGRREGKSFVASNLAVAFADAGHKTLLIDADLRRGSLYRILNTKRKPGMTDLLHGEASPEDVIQTTTYAPLCFVGCGTRTPDAPELLTSEAMTTFVAGVRQRFSVVIVDSPPLGAGVDAYALGAVTGNILMVLRLGTTDREAAEAKLDLLGRLPVRLLGTVLNDVPEYSAYSTYSYYMEGYAYEAEKGREPRTLAGRQPATRDRVRR
jgi:capsular exopolysaccharide synthesis family protein